MTMPTHFKITLIASTLVLTGCAGKSNNPDDPYEGYNRQMYRVNEGVDRVIYKPVAKAYQVVMPTPARAGISNFFSNINDVSVTANNILQGNFDYAANSTWRFMINSTVGVAGLFDVATKLGVPKYRTDFGVTLARWGFKPSPYFEIPLLGPSTVRDAVGFPVQSIYLSPYKYLSSVRLRNSLAALRFVDQRASLLDADRAQDAASLDPYVFRRNAFLQHRMSLINKANRVDASAPADYEEEWEDFDE